MDLDPKLFFYPDPIFLWLAKSSDQVPDLTLNIHNFTMPTILKVFSSLFKENIIFYEILMSKLSHCNFL
jgi:hypothetical protein